MKSTIDCIKGNDVWVYEMEGGDCGLIVAETYDEALKELKQIYDDIDERTDNESEKYLWGLSITPIINYYNKGNVIITAPY